MVELFRTNNVTTLSFAQSVLADAGIVCFVFDSHTSILEGSLGMLPRRLMVAEEDSTQAKQLLREAGLDDELNA